MNDPTAITMTSVIEHKPGTILHCGWGRLLFAHTFPDPESVARALLDEREDQRDIALYLTDPHIVLTHAPQRLFLDPSNTYRLDFADYEPAPTQPVTFGIERLQHKEDLDEINRIYRSHNMVPVDPDHVWAQRHREEFLYVIARHRETRAVIGVALGVDHAACFKDLRNGSSLWALAVDAQALVPGIGEALVRYLVEHFQGRGRRELDLSVMHDNRQATRLYEKLHFKKISVFAIKCRNRINEKLFVGKSPAEGYNPYATIIIEEALRRGIAVDSLDPPRGYFRLILGGRTITCRESLSDLTSAIAISRTDDKQLTRELLDAAGLRTPEQVVYTDAASAREFLDTHRRLVVKPLHGEQGAGVAVDVRTEETLARTVAAARECDDTVLLERYVEGQDLRIIVINNEVVAAAVRQPARVVGTGRHTIRELIDRLSRRRRAATGGESQIPVDDETERCLAEAGHQLDDILPAEKTVTVRKTANLHTGGTIHDVTPDLHPTLAAAAMAAARTLEIPVVGLDLIVPAVDGEEYVIIEANERPGLANHEPQPTAQKFIDFLFPNSEPIPPLSSRS